LLEMAQTGSNKKVANSLVALSSAAVLAVYAAGYSRTRSAASRLAAQAVERRPVVSQPLPETPPAALVTPAEPVPPSAPVPVRTAASSPIEPPAGAVDPPAEPAAPLPETKTEAVADQPLLAVPPVPVAAPAPPAPPPVPAPPAPAWKDGTYYGWGSSRHGDIQAAVVIESGHILSAAIAQCLTRYSCSVIDKLPPEVAQRQSPEVDYVSGATQSANAFYYAVVDALGKAR
jgi:uncharacterized protein with FMN-binding domain